MRFIPSTTPTSIFREVGPSRSYWRHDALRSHTPQAFSHEHPRVVGGRRLSGRGRRRYKQASASSAATACYVDLGKLARQGFEPPPTGAGVSSNLDRAEAGRWGALYGAGGRGA